MGKILIVRFPKNTSPERLKEEYEATQRLLGKEYTVLPFVTDVEKTEVEIVYDPHSMSESGHTETLCGSFERGNERQFAQVDTSTNAYMDGNGVAAMEMQEERLSRPTDSTRSTHTQCFREGSLAR